MKNRGFTLIELMIVVAIIAIIASIAIPNLLSARLNANESAAIATLRNIVSAQSQLQSQGAVDQDLDGIGEHGWFAEMAGSVGLRDNTGAASATLLTPPVLSGALGNVQPDGAANGSINRSGYFFKLFLPSAAAAPVGEAAAGGTPGGFAEGANFCENTWCGYAWPAGRNNTGNRTFMVNQSGDVLQTNNIAVTQQYTQGTPPAGLAAFAVAGPGDMTGPLSISNLPSPPNDGGVWVVVN